MKSSKNQYNSFISKIRRFDKIKILTFYRNTKVYIRESKKLLKNYPRNTSYWELMSFFPNWIRCLNPDLSPIKDEQPWITFAAINFLTKNTAKGMKVFEYGMGGSTLFFLKRGCEIVSVDNDTEWLNRVLEIARERNYNNWKPFQISPVVDSLIEHLDPSDPNAYKSGDPSLSGKSFKDYVSTIDNFPDKYFDIILIDGRARPSCFKHAIPKVQLGGYIIWDNTDRDYYFPMIKAVPPNLLFQDFPGPSPYANFFTRTSVWQRID